MAAARTGGYSQAGMFTMLMVDWMCVVLRVAAEKNGWGIPTKNGTSLPMVGIPSESPPISTKWLESLPKWWCKWGTPADTSLSMGPHHSETEDGDINGGTRAPKMSPVTVKRMIRTGPTMAGWWLERHIIVFPNIYGWLVGRLVG